MNDIILAWTAWRAMRYPLRVTKTTTKGKYSVVEVNQTENTLATQRRLMMEFLEQMDPLLEMLDGYRNKILKMGFSESAAEEMVLDLHEKLMRETWGQ